MRRWVWLAALVVAGCATRIPPQVGDPGPRLADSEQERAYLDVLHRYSRHAEIYDQLDSRVFAAATYQSWPFREARVNRQAVFKAEPPALVQANLAAEREQNARAIEFFFGAFVDKHQFDTFDKPDDLWRVVLVTHAGEIAPLKIERLGHSDLNMRAYYPYAGDFWVGYRMVFPRTMSDGTPVLAPDEKELTLRVASAIGKIELTYPVD